MKKIILILAVALVSCRTERVVVLVKVPVKTLQEDVNESIVRDFYNGDTLGKTVFLVR